MTAYLIEGEHFERLSCGNCGIVFLAPQGWVERRRDHGEHERRVYCPNGHERVWNESKLDRVERERDIARQQVARAEQDAAEARQRAEKAETATRKLKKRAAAGTCPCCQRTFSNMSTHMRKQHPEYVTEATNVLPLKKARA